MRKNGKGKGEWRKDPAKAGAWHWQWQLVPGGPMCPLGERVSSGALGALNLPSDPWGVRFGTGQYRAVLKGQDFFLLRTALKDSP